MRRQLAAELESWRGLLIGGELAPQREHLVGKNVLAASVGADPVDFVCDLLIDEDLDVLLIGAAPRDPGISPELRRMLANPLHMTGSDGIYRPSRIHPRGYGAFGRWFGRVVAEADLPLEEAVRHATSFPARGHGIYDRGVVRAGFAADLVAFDPGTIADRSTPADPARPADGVRHVVVNGALALQDGEPTGLTPGRGLRGTGRQSRGGGATTQERTAGGGS